MSLEQTTATIIREDWLRGKGARQEAEGKRFASFFPYLWPGADLWLELSRESVANQYERSIIEAESNDLVAKVSENLQTKETPVVVIWGIGAGVNEAALAKRLGQKFQGLDYVIIDGSKTIAEAGTKELMTNGGVLKEKIFWVQAPFEMAYKFVPELREKYDNRPLIHVMLGNTAANPADTLVHHEYFYPLLLSTISDKSEMIVIGWHTLPESFFNYRDVLARYDTEKFKRFVTTNLREQLKKEIIMGKIKVSAERYHEKKGFMIFAEYEDGSERIPCYRSGKHPRIDIESILKEAGHELLGFFLSENKYAGITVSRADKEVFNVDDVYPIITCNLGHYINQKGRATDTERIRAIESFYNYLEKWPDLLPFRFKRSISRSGEIVEMMIGGLNALGDDIKDAPVQIVLEKLRALYQAGPSDDFFLKLRDIATAYLGRDRTTQKKSTLLLLKTMANWYGTDSDWRGLPKCWTVCPSEGDPYNPFEMIIKTGLRDRKPVSPKYTGKISE
jgi:hypothetical protein